VTDEVRGDRDEGQEVGGLALVAAVRPAAAGRPGDRALDGPPVPSELLAGLDALAGDAVGDAPLAQPSPQVVVALVGVELRATESGAPTRPQVITDAPTSLKGSGSNAVGEG
jgi:hypothetical protein